ncbi:MAG: type IV toxin-antitoxin system AbiEi family antitoxin domain-containing protein [Pseudomonadota bacterium]|jgi:predicted transcriptional regulator of viral defense system
MEDTNPYLSLPEGRKHLAALVRSAGDVIRIDDAARVLGVDRSAAAKALARWVNQGWLRRVAHGAYVSASLDSLESEHVLDDPWVLVPALYAPAYVGGRTAAEHWDLTEQIFNDIVVLTTRAIRAKTRRHHGANFTLKHINAEKLFGTKTLWRAHTKVPISDVHRTIIDMLDDPAIGGGIRHVADCLANYLRRSDRNDGQLIAYAERLENGAVFKRLGFLVEGETTARTLIEACSAHLTKGNAKLDPALECPRLISRWKLWVPPSWSASVRQ